MTVFSCHDWCLRVSRGVLDIPYRTYTSVGLTHLALYILPLVLYIYLSVGLIYLALSPIYPSVCLIYLALSPIYPSVGLIYPTSALICFCPYRRFIFPKL